ncbi:hypothetical protein IWZ00DRAFT_252335 [Phyllosticta capitalensis]
MARPAVESKDLSIRLKFLDESAHLLSFGAPETSSFLEAQHDQLLRENGIKVPESRRREVCGACGTILIAGHSCKVLLDRRQPPAEQMKGAKRRKPESKVAPSSDFVNRKEKIYVCSNCHSGTRVTLPALKASTFKVKKGVAASAPAPDVRASSTESGNVSTPGPSVAEKSQSGTANVSSKKRAKARKGGLQAMLANSKKESKPTSSGFGLDLMDLMRSA